MTDRQGGADGADRGFEGDQRGPVGWPVGIVVGWFLLMFSAVGVLMTTGVVPAETWAVVWAVLVAALPASLLVAWRVQTAPRGEAHARELAAAVRAMVDESGLSESAKRVLHRKAERDLLRKAIEQDILARDFDAALVLTSELADRFGYRADAEGFRERIERARSQSTEEQISEAIRDFHGLLKQQKWNEAYEEAGRVQRLFNHHPRTALMRERVDESRESYRKLLERRFLEAAQRNEADDAMTLMRELDAYLSPEEAEPFQEVARGVISDARDNLGSRFKLLVKDHEWGAAVGVGQQIVEEFPNSRMAAEVRDLLPKLRERAGVGVSSVAVEARPPSGT